MVTAATGAKKMYIFICARVQCKKQTYTFSNVNIKTKQMHL